MTSANSPASEPGVLGIAGWSGAGKTTLITRVLPVLVARGLRVATIKHAHHAFDVDTPGKDSWEHRKAGASEVIVASGRRWVQMHELAGAPEPRLDALLRRLSPCDLVLVEGYKREPCPRLEVFRPDAGKSPLHPEDPFVVAVASNAPLPAPHPPVVDINDPVAVADTILACARPLSEVLAALQATSG